MRFSILWAWLIVSPAFRQNLQSTGNRYILTGILDTYLAMGQLNPEEEETSRNIPANRLEGHIALWAYGHVLINVQEHLRDRTRFDLPEVQLQDARPAASPDSID